MTAQSIGKIAVLMGGTSAERPVSLRSGDAVFSALKSVGADVVAIDVQAHAISQLTELDFDIAFIALHGRGGEDGTIQGVLEWLDKPYTGSGVMASALAMDKWRTKMIWQAAGLPTPTAFLLEDNSDWSGLINALDLNAIVKPAREGSSIGMRRVHNADELKNSYEFACEYDGMVLAERWVEGREFTVAIVDGEALPVIQLKTSHEFYDYDAKYEANDTEYLLPSELSEIEERHLQQLALKAFDILGAQGWGRIDVMQDRSGDFWLLEANTSPGMT
ncbi:MAG: D-alanine--D-alanine ligase, partial [Thalassolituus sp.]